MDVKGFGKWVTIGVALVGAIWSIASFQETQAINSRRPFLDLQLKLYEEAVRNRFKMWGDQKPSFS